MQGGSGSTSNIGGSGTHSPPPLSSLRPKEEEAYVKSLLEMSRSRRRKKKEELRELHGSLFRFNGPNEGNNKESDPISTTTSPFRNGGSSNRSPSPASSYGFRGGTNTNSWGGSWSSIGNVGGIHTSQSSPSSLDQHQQHNYTTPTICSEVRRVTTNYAHEQHKQLSDDLRASYLLKRMDELKNMNIKAMIDRSFNSSSSGGATRDQSQQTLLSSNNKNFMQQQAPPPTTHTKSNHPNHPTDPQLSPHSKLYEIERRKRVEARQQDKQQNSPNTVAQTQQQPQQQTRPQQRPSSARPLSSSSTPQHVQAQQPTIRSPEKFIHRQQSQSSTLLNNSSRKQPQQYASESYRNSKSPPENQLTSPTNRAVDRQQRPSSAPRREKFVETPKKSVPYNQRRGKTKSTTIDPLEKEEKLIWEQIQDLDEQLQKSVAFKSVVDSPTSSDDVSQKAITKQSKETDASINNSIASNRVSRPTTPSSSRMGGLPRSPSSYSRCSNTRPQSFETPKDTSLEEITRKNRELYGHIKPKVVSRRVELYGEQPTISNIRSERPASASRRVSGGQQPEHSFNDFSFSNTPKRPNSLPRKPRMESLIKDSHHHVRSVNVSLKNILLEQEEYKRVWGEIEEEELRILKFTPKTAQSNKSEKSEKENEDNSILSENSTLTSFTRFDFDDNSELNLKNVMRKRIEEIELGLKKIASLDPESCDDSHQDQKRDNESQNNIESQYRILLEDQYHDQPNYNLDHSSQSLELEQSKISSCGEADTSTLIEEKVSNSIDAFLSHGEVETTDSSRLNESALSASFIGDTSQIPCNPEFRKFINDKLDMLEKECSLHH